MARLKAFNSKRWWKRRLLLMRSVGLELPFIFGLGRGAGEEPKAIIQTSKKLALTRCAIHLLPTSVAIVVLVLNIGKSFLGKSLPGSIIDPDINIALLQIVAKIQELSMVASVTVVVMHVLRSELIRGRGLPVGLLGAGFQYSSLSYFWSPEFWGSFYVKYDFRTRCRLYGILFFGGLVATFAGPSTAILLIPRLQLWSAGATPIYLPGSNNTWWPSMVATDPLKYPEYCRAAAAIDRPECPSGGFNGLWSLRRYIDKLDRKTYIDGSSRTLTDWMYGPVQINVPGNFGPLGDIQLQGNHRGFACETTAWAPRAAEAMYLAQLWKDWTDEAYAIPYDPMKYGPSWTQYKYWDKVLDTVVLSRMPAVRVACLPAVDMPFEKQAVAVPVFSDSICWAENSTALIGNLTKPRDDEVGRLSMRWISPEEDLEISSAALVIQLPAERNASSRAVVGCAIDARWAKARTATRMPLVSVALFDTEKENSWSAKYSEGRYSDFKPAATESDAVRIHLTKAWLDSLTPFISLGNNTGGVQNATTLEQLVTDLGFVNGLPYASATSATSATFWNAGPVGRVNRTVALEWWISLMVTDGLARLGLSEVLPNPSANGTGPLLNYKPVQNFRDQLFNNKTALEPPTSNLTHQRVVGIWIDGYSYQASTLTDYAAIALLITFMVMALAHTIYSVFWTGQSSSSWDSLTELITLLLNSRPATKILKNTNAGIQDLSTFSKVGRVFGTRPDWHPSATDGQQCSMAELLFDEDTVDHEKTVNDPVEIGAETFPKSRNRRFASVSSVRSNDPLLEAIEFTVSPPSRRLTTRISAVLTESTDSLPPPLYEKIQADVRYS